MTSNLINHDNLQNFIVTDIPVWHRAYPFGCNQPDTKAITRQIQEATGIVLLSGQEGQEVHGFITSMTIPDGVNGTCGWCLEEGQRNTQHSCVIISLYQEHVGEEEAIETIIQKILQDHHENIQLPTPPTT